MKIVILAGGGGTRLFPLSRRSLPKQFLSIDDNQSLLGETILRCKGLVRAEDILIVTNQQYVQHVQSELRKTEAEGAQIVLEPTARSTAPAVALAAKYCMEKLGAGADEVLLIVTSDHIIRPAKAFHEAVETAVRYAEDGRFVTFGVQPDCPETGFGYIELGKALVGAYVTRSFKEKPDAQMAAQYLAEGNYLWNSGMFAFQIGMFQREIARHVPKISELSQGSYEALVRTFSAMPEISLDYAVAEHTDCGVTVPLHLYWNDVGSWDAIYDVLEKDAAGNAVKGDVISFDSHDNLIYGRSRLISTVGIQNLMIVETDDAILVAQRGRSQDVKKLVQTMKEQGRKELE